MAELVAGPANPGPIKLPAWDDVLHVTPRPEISNAHRAQLKAERRAGVNPTLDPAIVDEIDRRTARAAEIRESAVPEWRQKMLRVLTIIDNIEDQVSTIERVTRPILRKVPGGRYLSYGARGTSEALDRVQQVIRGPSLVGRKAKSKEERERRRDARQRKGKLGVVGKAADWIQKKQGALLEGAQATDTWFGVGIQLGAIFGAIEEGQDRALISAWEAGKWTVASAALAVLPEGSDARLGLEQQAEENINEIRRTGLPVVEQLERAIGSAGAALLESQPALHFLAKTAHLARASAANLFAPLTRAVSGSAYIAQTNPHYTPAEHALALIEGGRALASLTPALQILLDQVPMQQLLELHAPVARVTNPVTRAILEELGAELTLDGRGRGQWAERSITIETAIERGLADMPQAIAGWLPPATGGDEAQLLHALVEDQVPAIGYLLTAKDNGIATVYEPTTRAVMLLHHTGAYPPREIPRQALEAWLADQVRAIGEDPDGYGERRMLELTQAHWPLPPALAR